MNTTDTTLAGRTCHFPTGRTICGRPTVAGHGICAEHLAAAERLAAKLGHHEPDAADHLADKVAATLEARS